MVEVECGTKVEAVKEVCILEVEGCKMGSIVVVTAINFKKNQNYF